MGIRNSLRHLVNSARGLNGYPPRPEPQNVYTLVTYDGNHFEILDGNEVCGGVERNNTKGEKIPWSVHLYGIDLKFTTLGKARAWLGKPEVKLERA